MDRGTERVKQKLANIKHGWDRVMKFVDIWIVITP